MNRTVVLAASILLLAAILLLSPPPSRTESNILPAPSETAQAGPAPAPVAKEIFTTTTSAQQEGPTSTSVTSTPRYSLSLNGASAYVRVPNNNSFNITETITVDAWIKTNSTSSQGIIERYKWLGTPDGGFALRLNAEGKLQFYTIRSSAEHDSVTASTPLSTGVWHHVAGVFDGSRLRVYVDGVLVGEKPSNVAPAPGTADLRIGVNGDADAYFFNGLIDDARVTSGVRYAANFTPERDLITCKYVVEADGIGCHGVWTFNNQTAQDSTNFHNNGTLVGGAGFSSDTNNYQPEENISYQPETVEANAPDGEQKTIHFDELSASVRNVVNNRYPDIIFSAQGNLAVTTESHVSYGSSSPNWISASRFYNTPVGLNFPKPVDNLRFNILAGDDFGTIAQVDIWQDGTFRGTRAVTGIGRQGNSTPIIMNIGAEFNRVTQVVVHSITDSAGLGYDDFVFNLPFVPPPVPFPPSNLRVTFAFATKIDLAWTDNAGNETEFKVERCTGATCNNFVQIARLPANTVNFRDENVFVNTTYTYRVRAANDGGNSDYSNWVNATPTLVTPRDLTARADSATQITLNWSNGSGFEQQGFSMERSTDGVNWRHIFNLAANVREVTDISLEAGTTYHYRVRSFLNGQFSAYSNVASATTQACDFPTLNVEHRFGFQMGNHFWDFETELSDDDGLVVKDIRLDEDNSFPGPPGRLMANSISVPYYTIETTRFGTTRGELKLNSSDSVLRSRLVKYSSFQKDAYKIWVEATYSIDRLPNNSTSCLLITQRYEFYLRVPGDNCEPGGTLPCSRYRFSVNYDFRGNDGEQLKSINVVQRAHYAVDEVATNTVGLFLDCDYPGLCAFVTGGRPVFRDKKNPLMTEILTRAVVNGEKGDFDNFHQTWNAWRVDEPAEGIVLALPPAIAPGCPECVHSHWRWGYLLLGGEQRGSIIRLPKDSKQDINIAVTKFKPNGPDESDPISYTDLLNPLESIRRPNPNRSIHFIAGVPIILGSPTLPDEVVFWSSAFGKQPSDTFFEYGGFFNPTLKNKREDIIKRNQNLSPSEVGSPATVATAPDRPTSVVFANLYRAGQTSYVDLVPTTKAPIPVGYAVYNQDGFDIGTTSVASGDHTVTFSVESVTDSTTFNKLRVFHAEQNGLNPEQVIWVDRTILPPNASSPDFASKTISAKADYLGSFFIGIKTDEQPIPVKSTDLAVTGTRSPDTVVSGENLTYTFNVANNGPEQATDAQLHVGLSVQEAFVSATPSQGNCSFNNTNVICKLGNLSAGAGVSVTVVLKATEGDVPLPSSGVMIGNAALVIAGENDPNLNNNQVITNTRVLPNPNPPPAVRILGPATGQMFTGPTSVTLTAEATDSNGSISKVEFFDGDFPVGVAAAVGSNQYRFTWHNVPFGRHNIAAVATDNQGRAKISNASYFIVNGSAAVNITSPANGAGFGIPTNLTITATASQSGGSIAKVEFYAGVFLVGTSTTPNGNQYSVTWQNALAGTHSLTAVATDGAGITTTSNPVTVSIVDPATVNIISPLDGASFPQSPNLVVRAEARNRSGSISKVDFFANGVFIGTDATPGATQFFVDWNNVADGIYQLTAVATDNFGSTTTSAPVQITVNINSPEPGELIWFDDALPAGATPITVNDDWYWVDANPAALLNGKAHQTRLSNDFHQHAFHNATFKLPVNAGDRIFTYAFLDPNAMPSEIMLEWKAEDGWEHRAYWGLNKVEHLGANGTNSRRFMGALPFPGRWARLEVPAELVGLNGKTLEGMSFILFGGKATFDRMGKTSAPPPPTPASGDVVWFDDSLPAGATIPSDERVMKDDVWEWVGASPTPRSGGSSHRHFQAGDGEAPTYRSHAFVGANTPLVINPGDVLFTHIYLDPDPKYKPDQIILQWFDGQTWNHRAYWGGSFRTFGRLGTEHQRYMGGIPEAGRWVRLEIPASYVGLEGKSISGMAFGVNRQQRLARAAWDLTGKSTRTTVPVLPLQSTVPIYRFFNSNEGYSYWINDIGPGNRIPQDEQWHVHPNQAAGTVPFYRFRNVTSGQFFYTQFREGPGKPDANWTEDFDAFGSSVSFYIYPGNSTPGTAPPLTV